jgi:hypothetical protein|tara:strand:- start:59 stop:571 length:513 start_codon:yes stop_codon:yes gene_type:complete
MAEETPKNVDPERDIKPVMDRIDALLAEGGAGEEGEMIEDEAAVEEEMPMGDEMPEEEMMAEGEEAMEEGMEGEVDLAPLMDTLGATEERAQALYDAAQQIQKTAGKTPQELADMIAEDFDVLMQLEMLAARGGEPQAMPEGMGAMGGPPVGGAPPSDAPSPVPAEMEGA